MMGGFKENITRDERASRLKALYDYDQKEMIEELRKYTIRVGFSESPQ